jgi:hypothetical protein
MMNLKTKRYLLGMVNAFISGATSSTAGFMADPKDFNLDTLGGIKHMAILMGVSGVMSFIKYLTTHPITEILPQPDDPGPNPKP